MELHWESWHGECPLLGNSDWYAPGTSLQSAPGKILHLYKNIVYHILSHMSKKPTATSDTKQNLANVSGVGMIKIKFGY